MIMVQAAYQDILKPIYNIRCNRSHYRLVITVSANIT